jgi:DNA replication and repair protein RecF
LPKLKNISFYQYKNYSSQSFGFSNQITCIYGANGVGKTNILDAIYYLGYTKSYFAKKDADVVQHLQSGMFIAADYILDDETECAIKIIIRENGKKELTLNGQETKQLQQHIGKFPCIMISPDDTELISEGGELRRKFLDGILCQIDAEYFSSLIAYNKILLLRNATLKNWMEAGSGKKDILGYYTSLLIQHGQFVFEARQKMLLEFIPIVQQYFKAISGEENNIGISYVSKLINNHLHDLYEQTIDKDIILKRTTIGIHRDDLSITIDGHLCKDFASQGQRKTVLFALKMAQYFYLKQQLGITPILLLDDVFEKLDANRSQQLLQWISQENCQTFITDTHLHRLQQAFVANLHQVGFIEIK